jgi:hypothetical protein
MSAEQQLSKNKEVLENAREIAIEGGIPEELQQIPGQEIVMESPNVDKYSSAAITDKLEEIAASYGSTLETMLTFVKKELAKRKKEEKEQLAKMKAKAREEKKKKATDPAKLSTKAKKGSRKVKETVDKMNPKNVKDVYKKKSRATKTEKSDKPKKKLGEGLAAWNKELARKKEEIRKHNPDLSKSEIHKKGLEIMAIEGKHSAKEEEETDM